jgi:3-hydroxybutyryl-CoA dehydrogenase
MQVLILSDDLLKEELSGTTETKENIVWVNSITDFDTYKDADVFVDLLFEHTTERIALLQQLLPKPVIINSVLDTLLETNTSFIRIGGWPTFLGSGVIEASCLEEDIKPKVEEVFQLFRKKIQWLPDEPGFVTPRVISTIINEAFFALAEGISTMDEIDTAMKLGTAYPYGPFTWSRHIGLQNIATLLHKLSMQHKRYTPSDLLVQQTDQGI